jgi:uncharacterized surface protein with fasciclin (FAS1) repeats
MRNEILKTARRMLVAATGATVLSLTACNPEPDESDLYTFTGETIESFIQSDSTLSSFNYVLQRVRYDRLMAAYGTYTCFAPTNEGMKAYCDSLYDDVEAVIPHNGMTERSIEGLTDSLCLNIVRYHLSGNVRTAVNLTGTGEVSTLLGYEFSFASDSLGRPVFNNKATVISSDNEVTNGVVHIIDNVIPRFTRFIGDVLERAPQYSIFSQALEATGLGDSLMTFTKGDNFTFYQRPRENYSGTLSWESSCKVGYTLFAESDEVMRQNGINSFEDLVRYANEVYGGASDWYDYIRENGISVSTGDDYTNRFNALNMFVAYHILYASMSENQLVFEQNSSSFFNYKPDADMYDYYETMLPHTILKVWEPRSENRNVYINRYQTNNTLTNEVGTTGTNHELIRRGVRVVRNEQLAAYNGYVLSINGMLVYDRIVPRGVLNERMRVNCTSLFPELINNRYRYWSTGDGNIANTYDTSRRGLPSNLFDNLVVYDDVFCLAYCLRGAWRCWQADQIQFWGRYDIAFKLPSVPSGLYEIRVVYAPMTYGSFMQYYIGTSSNVQSMTAIGLPFDATVQVEDPRIGLTDPKAEDDQGIESDMALRNRGYMRGPHSYCGHGENGYADNNSARTEWGTGSLTVRYILGRVQLNQGQENWLRIKTLNPDNTMNPVGLDFVELAPVSVTDNQEYSEDWY